MTDPKAKEILRLESKRDKLTTAKEAAIKLAMDRADARFSERLECVEVQLKALRGK